MNEKLKQAAIKDIQKLTVNGKPRMDIDEIIFILERPALKEYFGMMTLRMVEHDLKLMMAYINSQENYAHYTEKNGKWTSLEKARWVRIKSFAETAVSRIQELSA